MSLTRARQECTTKVFPASSPRARPGAVSVLRSLRRTSVRDPGRRRRHGRRASEASPAGREDGTPTPRAERPDCPPSARSAGLAVTKSRRALVSPRVRDPEEARPRPEWPPSRTAARGPRALVPATRNARPSSPPAWVEPAPRLGRKGQQVGDAPPAPHSPELFQKDPSECWYKVVPLQAQKPGKHDRGAGKSPRPPAVRTPLLLLASSSGAFGTDVQVL